MSYAANRSSITTLHGPLEFVPLLLHFPFKFAQFACFLQISYFSIEAQLCQNSQLSQSPNIFYCLDSYTRFIVPMKGNSKPEDKFRISGKEN